METLKNELKPWQKKAWCIPKPGAEFVARMEDVLDVYERPYAPPRPVVCLDETNRQLIEKRRIPSKPGSPEREDYEYRRCGVADLFAAFEPLACKREVKLTDAKTAVDFAHFLRELVEVHYIRCEKIVLVMRVCGDWLSKQPQWIMTENPPITTNVNRLQNEKGPG